MPTSDRGALTSMKCYNFQNCLFSTCSAGQTAGCLGQFGLPQDFPECLSPEHPSVLFLLLCRKKAEVTAAFDTSGTCLGSDLRSANSTAGCSMHPLHSPYMISYVNTYIYRDILRYPTLIHIYIEIS